jgi:hypothetical protein
MKYIKLFENFSSEDEDVEAHLAQQYEDEKLSIDDLKIKLIDLLNEKFGGPYCELESDPENENLFTIISNVGEEKKLEFEIKPYESEGREGYPNYVLHLNSDDISEEAKRNFQIFQWSFREERLHYLVDFIYKFLFGVYNK